MFSKQWFRFFASLILIPILLTGCGSGPSSGFYVWIDVPVNGLNFPDIRPIMIEGHATGPDLVRHVEIYVNGDLWTTLDDLSTEGSLTSFHAEWLPRDYGTYTIHVVAYGSEGSASQPDDIRISFGEEEISEEVVAEVPTEEESEPDPEEEPIGNDSVIQFWAEPETISAGGCTDIKWHAENVKKVVLGGIEQAFDGVYQDCLCKNQTYSLIITHLDDSEEKRQVGINVTGSCVTPEPAKDTTPPPTPVQSVPSNGLTVDCKGNQNLVWQPVTDESGISQYQVKVQRHSGDNNWSDIPGSVFQGISGKQHSISVECGWYYRWKVRAIDGEGNVGSWSGWWTFVINLI